MKEVKFHHPTVQLELSLGVNTDTEMPYIAVEWGGVLEKASHMQFVLGAIGWIFIYNKKAIWLENTAEFSEIDALRAIVAPALVDYLLELKQEITPQCWHGVTKDHATRLATAVGIPIDFIFNTTLSMFFDIRLQPKTPHHA